MSDTATCGSDPIDDSPPLPAANIAESLRESARRVPDRPAVIIPPHRWRRERCISFTEFDQLCDRLATGLIKLGISPGDRIVLMVRFGMEFIALTYALFRAGATVVLIDPGMGIRRLGQCAADVDPRGFVAIPIAHWFRRIRGREFPNAKYHVRVGGPSLDGLRSYWSLARTDSARTSFPAVCAEDPAAIIFTSGGTGPAKGVLYEHGMFAAQVELLRDRFAIQSGEVDVPAFPLFGLFNGAMGVTTVIPDFDPTRPARVDPRKMLEPIRRYGATQAFASPALWDRVGRYCEENDVTIPHLRRVFSAGAPVPVPVLERMSRALTEPGVEFHTPYGATEALPVAVIDAGTVLNETARASRMGAGTCVGEPFGEVDVRIIERTNEPIGTMAETVEMPTGEIGEIIVRSRAVTREYYRQPQATALAKIADGDTFWHRMGDVGYLDEVGKLWFCGRKAHVVETAREPLYSVCCEAIFNEHPRVFRSALVGVGDPGRQKPVIIVELQDGQSIKDKGDRDRLYLELRQLAEGNPLTEFLDIFLVHQSFPVDVRHNIKIDRRQLAVWACGHLSGREPSQ